MGIVILPFLLIIFIVGIIALNRFFKLLKLKEIRLREVILGFITSLILFGFVCLIYVLQGSAWALSTVFRIPIWMILIPFIIHYVLEKNKEVKIEIISKVLLVSIVFTLIFTVIFNDIFFNLLDYIGVRKYY